MTRIVVSILSRTYTQTLAMASRAAEHGADLVEFRLDPWEDPPQRITQLIDDSPLGCVVTCRPRYEGGMFTGSESDRLDRLAHAFAGVRKPVYLDIELAAWQKSSDVQQRVLQWVDHPGQVEPSDTGLILSSHDFEHRPADLYQRVEAMAAASPCRAIKLAWQARTVRDNFEALELMLQRPKPTAAMCMGPDAVLSRTLAPKFAALLVYASLDDEHVAAPGQVSISKLKQLYRFDQINPATKVYAVIGHPVGHSLSPHIHNAGFDHASFDGVYVPMDVAPSYEAFKATVATMLDFDELHFRGASVTIPHKANLLRFVQERDGQIEPLAHRIGAANTLVVGDDGRLLALNSDYAAALDAVCEAMACTRKDLAGQRVAVIGAGGAARAIVAGFADCGCTVVIYNRTHAKAQQMAEAFADLPGKIVAMPLARLCDSCCQIIINGTPIGMYPNVNDSPLDQAAELAGHELKLEPGTVVFDTIYNPAMTKLLRDAREAGCVTVSGVEMFVRQAAVQFNRWTSKVPPLDVFRKVMAQAM